MGARVIVLDVSLPRLRYMDDIFVGRVETLISNPHTISSCVTDADMVIVAALITGARTPWLVTRDMIRNMPSGSVIVDVSVDQGGCVETSRPTSHSDPVFTLDSVTHYCVANIPGAVPRTSTFALTNATFPGLMELAQKGVDKTLRENYAMRKGLNVAERYITHRKVAESLGLPCKCPKQWD